MTIGAAPVDAPARRREIPLSAALWLGVTAIFLGLRLGPTWQAPVGGAELAHLSGAWQAQADIGDSRFVPSLFQALCALLFNWTASEVPARILAFAATATVPAAIYCLRPRLGEAGALLTLVILAFDAPAIVLGSTASAMGFDLAITAWLFVALDRPVRAPWAWAVLGFLVASAGPLALPLAAGAATVAFLRREQPPGALLGAGAVGVAAAVAATSAGFGFGADGLVVAPFRLLDSGSSTPWSTATAAQVVALYSWPLLVGGIVAAGWCGRRLLFDRAPDRTNLLLLAWCGFAAAWLVATANAHSALPVTALTLPLALLLGPALSAAITAMTRADWRFARYLVPAGVVAASLAGAVVVDWASNDRTGGADDWRRVLAFVAVAGAALVFAGNGRRRAPALWSVAIGVAALPLLAGAMNVGLSAVEEPIPSPVSPSQARLLRDVTFELQSSAGGEIAIHDSFRKGVAWAFRDSGPVLIVSRVPAEANVAIWPSAAPPPDGFTRLEGEWAFMQAIKPPTGDGLDYLRWFIDRNSPAVMAEKAIVYTRDKE
ncbi:MAG: hypothetical protein HY875_06180 [Chloroflexi bacterium]|nr:hypothetical protein [Chloroflexota bacterium]